MTSRKERLTVTVDPELVAAGNQAVATGRADSLSGWVNAALIAKASHDRRLEALTQAVAGYEAEFGEITDAEIAGRQRIDRGAAVVVRGHPVEPTRGASKRRSARNPHGQGAA